MSNPLPNNYDCPICNKNEEQILEETGSYQHSSVNKQKYTRNWHSNCKHVMRPNNERKTSD